MIGGPYNLVVNVIPSGLSEVVRLKAQFSETEDPMCLVGAMTSRPVLSGTPQYV